jgi:hypothetical protein
MGNDILAMTTDELVDYILQKNTASEDSEDGK